MNKKQNVMKYISKIDQQTRKKFEEKPYFDKSTSLPIEEMEKIYDNYRKSKLYFIPLSFWVIPFIICVLSGHILILAITMIIENLGEDLRVILMISSAILTVLTFALTLIMHKPSVEIKKSIRAFYQNKYDEQLAIAQANIMQDMNITNRIVVENANSSLINQPYYEFLLDENSKKCIIQKSKEEFYKINFSDIMSYEVLEDKQKVISGTAGKVLSGGLLFGWAGVFAGATSKRTVSQVTTEISLLIRLKHMSLPLINITYKVDKNGYMKVRIQIEKVVAMLEYMMNDVDLAASIAPEKISPFIELTPQTSSLREKLVELKALLDDGLISQEDYDNKKNQLLKQ